MLRPMTTPKRDMHPPIGPLKTLTLLALMPLACMTIACMPEDGPSPGPSRPQAAPDRAPAASDDGGLIVPGSPPDARVQGRVDAAAQPIAVDASLAPDLVSGLLGCGEISSVDCFSNLDCGEALSCRNVGTEASPVACCVDAVRGDRALGAVCDPAHGEAQCESGLCLEGDTVDGGARCTGPCDADADCPPGLDRCIPIAFSGSDRKFCFPPASPARAPSP